MDIPQVQGEGSSVDLQIGSEFPEIIFLRIFGAMRSKSYILRKFHRTESRFWSTGFPVDRFKTGRPRVFRIWSAGRLPVDPADLAGRPTAGRPAGRLTS